MEVKIIIVTSLAIACVQAASPGSNWNYDESSNIGPANWGNIQGFEGCGTGTEQSPINIQASSATYRSYPPLNVTSNSSTGTFRLENDGIGPIGIPDASNINYLTGGPLGDRQYRLQNFHLHYGNSTYEASEHAFDNMRTSSEIHFVFYNNIYANISAALDSKDRDALAVIGILFSTSMNVSHAHPSIVSILNFFAPLTYPGDTTTEQLDFSTVLRPEDVSTFYTYNGSLTTPSCNEQVVWLVMSQIQYYPPTVIDSLSSLLTTNRTQPPVGIIGNTRPLQPLNSRTIYQNFQNPTMASTTSGSGLMNISLFVMLLSFIVASV
eukprot:scpid78781/ scgid4408/ Carbonic anhydrase 1; Carbonate dehydratase I; Carbonic anhydrase I